MRVSDACDLIRIERPELRVSDVCDLIRIECPELDPDRRVLRRCHNVDDLRSAARRRLPRGAFDYIDGGARTNGASPTTSRRSPSNGCTLRRCAASTTST